LGTNIYVLFLVMTDSLVMWDSEVVDVLCCELWY